jgi:hypothetical protein
MMHLRKHSSGVRRFTRKYGSGPPRLVRLGGAVVDDTMGQSGPLLIVESVVLVLAVAATLTVGGAKQ